MSPITGNASRRLKEELSKLSHGYKPVLCYLIKDNEEVSIDCMEVPKLINKVFSEGIEIKVCNEGKGVCVNLTKDDDIVAMPVEGREVYFIVSEGDEVSKDQRIGYIITGKGEVRTIRSPKDGVIFLLHEELGEKYSRFKVFIKGGGK